MKGILKIIVQKFCRCVILFWNRYSLPFSKLYSPFRYILSQRGFSMQRSCSVVWKEILCYFRLLMLRILVKICSHFSWIFPFGFHWFPSFGDTKILPRFNSSADKKDRQVFKRIKLVYLCSLIKIVFLFDAFCKIVFEVKIKIIQNQNLFSKVFFVVT